jgi:hypothetical protein
MMKRDEGWMSEEIWGGVEDEENNKEEDGKEKTRERNGMIV